MSPLHKCPFCSSWDSHLVSSFYSAVLNAQTTTYQCQHCLALFDFPYRLAEIDSEEKKELVTIYAYDYLMNLVAVDSYWADPNDFRRPNLQSTTPTTTGVLVNIFDLVTSLFILVFSILLTMLGIGFVVSGVLGVG